MARNKFRCQKCRKLGALEHFLKFRGRKSARSCGAKHMSKSKVEKTGKHFLKFRCRKSARQSECQKVVQACGVFRILASKCASRPNGVHFFDISTSRNGPGLVCFVHFDLEMCFVTQQRALFGHLNFKKCSEPVSFSHF